MANNRNGTQWVKDVMCPLTEIQGDSSAIQLIVSCGTRVQGEYLVQAVVALIKANQVVASPSFNILRSFIDAIRERDAVPHPAKEKQRHETLDDVLSLIDVIEQGIKT